MRLRKIWAFTLIELLVVVSIISLLMSILLPSLNKAREQARRAACMANLWSIGQCLHLYAQDNEGKLVPGNSWCDWYVWGQVTEFPQHGMLPSSDYQQVNLGYLLTSENLPMPTSGNYTFFCPSSRLPNRKQCYEDFRRAWGSDDTPASISYMYNNALDGFESFLNSGHQAVLSHHNKINYLMSDGSVHTFNVKRMVFDAAGRPELLQQVAARYGVCFPTVMLHQWLARDEVDLDEAKQYLNDPACWMTDNCTLNGTKLPNDILLANVSKKSLVCDMVGVLGQQAGPAPPG
ncbi:MAG: prepilin-type N-terminal cleavage/methylation domain-containing protein [Planctomycetota bacterium]